MRLRHVFTPELQMGAGTGGPRLGMLLTHFKGLNRS